MTGVPGRMPVPGEQPARSSLARATVAAVWVDGTLAIAGLAATPYLIRVLGAERYGIFGLVTVLIGQLVGLQLGLGWAATRRVAEGRAGDEAARRAAIVRAVAVVGSGSAGLVGLAFAFLAPLAWTRAFRGSPPVVAEAMASVGAGVVIAASQTLILGLNGILYGEERLSLVQVIRVTHGLGRLGAAVGVAALGGRVYGVLWGQALVDLAVILVLAAAALPGRGPARPTVTASSLFAEARSLLAVGIPYALAGILVALLGDIEKIAIAVARTVEDFTYYSVPFNVTARLVMLGIALSSVLAPRLSALAAAAEGRPAAELAGRAARLSLGGMTLLLAPLLALTPELLTAWLGASFSGYATTSTRILLVAVLPRTYAFVAEAVLRAWARPITFTALYAAELLLHFAAVALLVHLGGIRGAALAWGMRALVDALAQQHLATRALGAPVGRWVEILTPLVLLAAFAWACEALAGPVALRLAGSLLLGGGCLAWLLSPGDRLALRRLVRW